MKDGRFQFPRFRIRTKFIGILIIAAVTMDDMRSRVAGVFGTINYGARPVGAVIGGLLGSAIGVRPTLVVAAVGGVLACLWLLRSPIPALRTLPEVALVA